MRPSLGTTLSTRACGGRAPEAVWTAYTTPTLWSSWSPQVRGVCCAQPDVPVRAGTRGDVLGPAGVRVPFEVTDVDLARQRWTWRVRVGTVVLEMTHGVTPRADGRCCAWARLSGPLPLVAGYLPLARLALGRLVGRREPA
jgi:uncharacterized protein YndB with AHSA1/START domain